MSILQSKQKDLRFLKRKNLSEESRIVGNYYSDLIRQYGIDCVYYKLNTDIFGDFKGIIDNNTVLLHAYKGYDYDPDYTCSAEMITYPEMQTDIFQLNKYGIVPQAEVDFHFDSKQFACDLAARCGQLKEYPIEEKEIICEVPDYKYHYETIIDEYGNEKKIPFPDIIVISSDDGKNLSVDANNEVWPYDLGLAYKETFKSGILDGKLSVVLDGYEYGVQKSVVCRAYEHTDFKVDIKKNPDLYASLEYQVMNDDYLDSLIFLDFTVNRIPYDLDKNGNQLFKNILTGKIHGSILFYDLNKIGKYLDLIHPEIGDIVEIDFPDDTNREKYQITDCYDKSLQSDGISPLLHKYIWKCKAKRYVSSYDDNDISPNEADQKLDEKIKHDLVVEEEIVKKISKYDKGDQEAYGGYDGVVDEYDHMKPNPYKQEKYDYLSDGECLDIIRFGIGSRLVTNGYDLIFVNKDSDGYIVSKNDPTQPVRDAYFECDLRWLKASNQKIVFINIEGDANTLVEDEVATQNEIQLCLNDLNEKTLDVGEINHNQDNFLKFKGTRSYLWSDGYHLYAKLQSNQQLYKII